MQLGKDFNLDGFKAFLEKKGFVNKELSGNNPYEVLKYSKKGRNGEQSRTFILYINGKGYYTCADKDKDLIQEYKGERENYSQQFIKAEAVRLKVCLDRCESQDEFYGIIDSISDINVARALITILC